MMKRKRSDRASARASSMSPAPECHDVKQSEAEESPPAASTFENPLKGEQDGWDFLQEVEEYFKDVDPDKHNAFENLLLAQAHAEVALPCSISQVMQLFRGHPDMIKFFNEILHPEYRILVKEDVPEIQDLAKLYVAKVKLRSSPSEYTTFLHILYLNNERALTSEEVDQEVEVLFAECCDLLEEFECLRSGRAAPVAPSSLHPRHSALEVSELEREQQSERLQRMCEDVAKRKRKEKGKGVVIKRPQPQPNALGNRRSSRSSAEAHPRRPTHTTPSAETRSRIRIRVVPNSESDLIYIGRAMCTPSYLMLKPPKSGDGDGDGEGKADASVHRSELAKSVLNEECELVSTSDFKHRTHNDYEDKLFKCEDNQYHSDLVIKKYEATVEKCMKYLLKLQESNGGELPPLGEFLSTMHKGCIQKMYGNHTQAIMEALEMNLAGGLHVLLNRLILKLESFKSLKAKITPKWSQVYKANFYLSLGKGNPEKVASIQG